MYNMDIYMLSWADNFCQYWGFLTFFGRLVNVPIFGMDKILTCQKLSPNFVSLDKICQYRHFINITIKQTDKSPECSGLLGDWGC